MFAQMREWEEPGKKRTPDNFDHTQLTEGKEFHNRSDKAFDFSPHPARSKYFYPLLSIAALLTHRIYFRV